MNNIFEQLSFLKPMINSNSPKVQLCAFWSAISIIIAYMSKMFYFMADNILGISVPILLLLIVVMIIDHLTGVKAAKREGDELLSKKGLRWAIKFGVYLFFIYMINMLESDFIRMHELHPNNLFFEYLAFIFLILKYYIILFIIYWETKSIDENFERLGFSFRIFKIFNNVYRFVIALINKVIKEKTGIEVMIEDKEKDKK